MPSSGTGVTDAAGQATFCYTSALPGADTITAFADTDNSGTQDVGEPSATATKDWILPTSGSACKVTYGGRITTTDGDKATFGGNAKGAGPSGQEEYQDHGSVVDMNLHSIDVQSVVCSEDGLSASIFGTATIDGVGSVDYRIDVTDNGEPGRNDTYEIRLSNGYDSGLQTLVGGNVQVHKASGGAAAAVSTAKPAKPKVHKTTTAHTSTTVHGKADTKPTASTTPKADKAPKVDRGKSSSKDKGKS